MKASLVSLSNPVIRSIACNSKRNISFSGRLDSEKFEPSDKNLVIANEKLLNAHLEKFNNAIKLLNESFDSILEEIGKNEPGVKAIGDAGEQIDKNFINKLPAEAKGEKVEFPNSIMILGKDSEVIEEFIELTKKESGCNIEEIKSYKIASVQPEVTQNILFRIMEQSEETFRNTKKRTLIHVENFDRLIDPKLNSPDNIKNLLDIMKKAASEFGTTIIYGTDNPTQLTKEAIESSRNLTVELSEKITLPDFETFSKVKEIFNLKFNKLLEGFENDVQKVKDDFSNTIMSINKKEQTIITGKGQSVPKSSKAFKIIAILAAIIAAITGAVYFMRNKNKQQGAEENASQSNISSGKQK